MEILAAILSFLIALWPVFYVIGVVVTYRELPTQAEKLIIGACVALFFPFAVVIGFVTVAYFICIGAYIVGAVIYELSRKS